MNKKETFNETSLDTLCASLCYALNIEKPACANEANPLLTEFIDKAFGGEKADKIVMYNPDAVAEWIYLKYPQLVKEIKELSDIEVPMQTVMPSVTPVCFGTMYTGAQPSVHGIMKYEKPVITIDTIFDALIRAGKKPVIISQTDCSMSKIYLERNMDYFIYDTIGEVNAKAADVLINGDYDFIAIYNTNYDYVMHRHGPESLEALSELRYNSITYSMISNIIKNHYKDKNVLLGFAMDHGCHEIDGDLGSHGLYMPEDINICHLYKAFPKEK
ncbi:MAG: alkaline phosphatase family protein [Clostridia bacterium]|nr:alkaline phosphatase family protein [Clostridia bacterium]